MGAATRSLLALLLCRVLLGGAAGLMPPGGRRRLGEPGRAAPAAQRPEELLGEFELRLLHMFGLKRRPSPGKDVVIPPYMLDLYRLHAGQRLGQAPALGYPLERAASRANTVRSFHHEGRGGRGVLGGGEGRGGAAEPRRGGPGALRPGWVLSAPARRLPQLSLPIRSLPEFANPRLIPVGGERNPRPIPARSRRAPAPRHPAHRRPLPEAPRP